MNIKIELDVPLATLNQAKISQISRVATVLRSGGFIVTVTAPIDPDALGDALEDEERLRKRLSYVRE
jgi:hypothetical protein